MPTVRVTVERPCPELCDDGVIRVYALNGLQTGEERCERCHGRGAVDEPVTCRTCEYWASLLNGTVTRCTLIGHETAGTFACAAWEARR
jgi:DnaJ-class molecular chaperone